MAETSGYPVQLTKALRYRIAGITISRGDVVEVTARMRNHLVRSGQFKDFVPDAPEDGFVPVEDDLSREEAEDAGLLDTREKDPDRERLTTQEILDELEKDGDKTESDDGKVRVVQRAGPEKIAEAKAGKRKNRPLGKRRSRGSDIANTRAGEAREKRALGGVTIEEV